MAEAPLRALDEASFVAALETSDPRFERLDAEAAVSEAELAAAGVRSNPEIAFDREALLSDGGGATNYARILFRLDLAGRRGRRTTAARAIMKADAAAVATAKVALVVDGLRTFDEAAYARLRVELLHRERATLVRAADIVDKRSRAGASSGYDARRIALELAAYDDLIASAEIELHVSRLRLGALVGAEAVDARSELALPSVPADEVALDTRGDYRATQLREQAAVALDRLARRGWIPEVGASVGGMSADIGDDTATGYTVGLTISLPIFDRGQGERARARAIRRVAHAERRVIETHVPRRVAIARETLTRRIAQAEALATRQLAALDDLTASAETAYREGETRIGDLLDAHRAARETRLRDLELRRDARLAELDLWLALGKRP